MQNLAEVVKLASQKLYACKLNARPESRLDFGERRSGDQGETCVNVRKPGNKQKLTICNTIYILSL